MQPHRPSGKWTFAAAGFQFPAREIGIGGKETPDAGTATGTTQSEHVRSIRISLPGIPAGKESRHPMSRTGAGRIPVFGGDFWTPRVSMEWDDRKKCPLRRCQPSCFPLYTKTTGFFQESSAFHPESSLSTTGTQEGKAQIGFPTCPKTGFCPPFEGHT